MEPFDILKPLPGVGTTLLEASAGTGKTWTIGALVARYVAEGVATLDDMLIVTFTRAASRELRDRVRQQLVMLERHLADPSLPLKEDNEVVQLLLQGDPDELALRHQRVRDALSSFDAATIATIHQFCQLVLRSLGVAGSNDPDATLVDDLSGLLDEVVDDLYLRGFAHDSDPIFDHKTAGELARAAVYNPRAKVIPDPDPTSVPGRRAGFVQAVRNEIDRRKRAQGVLSYDDLLTQLADALEPEDSPARQRMRDRWSVVLVDEFQDTDPIQWQVFDRAFSGYARMVLIGDPKQAIYAFRGGDVFTYLEASHSAQHRLTLGINWRSDQQLVDAIDQVMGGVALGDPAIVVHPVTAHRDEARLVGAPISAPLRVRRVPRDPGMRKTAKIPVGWMREVVAADAAADIAALLSSGATYDGRPLTAGDVAVLTYRKVDLTSVAHELQTLGIPSVMAAGDSVFKTPGARAWLTLLEALEQPHRAARVRAVALTPFGTMTSHELDEQGAEATDALSDQVRDWRELVQAKGVAALFEALSADGLAARVLAEAHGERTMTDLRHIAQILHEETTEQQLGLVALVGWYRDQIRDALHNEGSAAAQRTLRLDTDERAVQLVTIHSCKGLEYPIVYLPFIGERYTKDPDVPLFHGDADSTGGRPRVLDVGGSQGQTLRSSQQAVALEEAGESLRLLYVALTRAKSQIVTWWSPNTSAGTSAWHRFLMGHAPGEADVPDFVDVAKDDVSEAVLRQWVDRGAIHLENLALADVCGAEPAAPAPAMAVRTFTRRIDHEWRRTSYSGLTADAPHATPGVTSEPEVTPRDDEALPVMLESERYGIASPMAALPVGADFGSLVHAVLEHADPAADDWAAELSRVTREQLVRWPVPDLDVDRLVAALVAVCDSPLGPLAAGRTLRSILRADRMTELDFEMPLSGGDHRRDAPELTLASVAPLLRAHLAEGDPVRAWADVIDGDAALRQQSLRGYLTGSVDLIARLDEGSGPRFVIADYKTNWLGGSREEQRLSALDYAPARLDEAMGHSTYPLQALLYSVVLHRFLRWRLAGYDPEQHFGGVLYLYVRGMVGAETPVIDGQPCGVFSWRPPMSLVTSLSDLLDGRGVLVG